MEVCQAFYLPFFGYYAGKTKIFFVLPHTESGLALSLFVALALGADHHNSAVSLDNFALFAHRFYGRSDFHSFFLLVYS